MDLWRTAVVMCLKVQHCSNVTCFIYDPQRLITDAHWFVSNKSIHDDLYVPFVTDVINSSSLHHFQKLETRPTNIVALLLEMHGCRFVWLLNCSLKQLLLYFWSENIYSNLFVKLLTLSAISFKTKYLPKWLGRNHWLFGLIEGWEILSNGGFGI